MKATLALVIAGCVALAGCDNTTGGGRQGTGAGNSDNGPGPGPSNGDETGTGQPVPTSGTVGARVRNFSDLYADVTLRFLLNDIQVHLTFLRVPPQTSTTVIGPEQADTIEASGVDADGETLPDRTFVFGVDFDDDTEAVYIIEGEEPPIKIPPTLVFIEPAQDVRVPQGGILHVVIDDEDPDSSATIDFYLDPDDMPLNGNEILLGEALQEDPDGPDDAFDFPIGADIPEGFYRLVGVIADEVFTEIVQARAVVEIFQPSFGLVKPAVNLSFTRGSSLIVEWVDRAPNDNATIDLYLDPDEQDLSGDEISLATGIEEDPEGNGDRAVFPLSGMPFGQYRVFGRMVSVDGTVTAVAPGRITIAPVPETPPEPPPPEQFADCQPNGIVDGTELEGNDCNNSGVPDDCELTDNDCNTNGQPDECDLDGNDCNNNGKPDVCDLPDSDCDSNGTLDECELAGQDCNTNETLDECDIAGGTSDDCNTNESPDSCDIADGTSQDCNNNSTPDECDIAGGASDDCNTNDAPDSCDIADGTSQDCNNNSTPDECDIAGGTSDDCNTNDTPDSCDIADGTSQDCNTNDVPDSCDIAGGTSDDCNTNGKPDSCDIADGTSQDCNTNDTPDSCDIANGTSGDCNTNGVPDECEDLGGFDGDQDGVPDVCDACPTSITFSNIIIGGCDSDVPNQIFSDGCTMSDFIAVCAANANNHGQFDNCVTALTNGWANEGLMSDNDSGRVQSCAAGSNIP